MVLPVLTSIILPVICFCISAVFLVSLKRWRMMPPGPWGIPVLGYMPWISTTAPWETLTKLKKKYGQIFTVNFSGAEAVVLSDPDVLSEALAKPSLSDRPYIVLFDLMDLGNKGLSGNGKAWAENRNFTQKSLRYFGVGKGSRLEETIVGEAAAFVASLKSDSNFGKPMEIDRRLDVAILNVIWRIASGKQSALDDEKPQALLKTFHDMAARITQLGPAQFFPFLTHVVPKFKRTFQEAKALARSTSVIFEREIAEHKEYLGGLPTNCPRDFIDDYLSERYRREAAGDDGTDFDDGSLFANITALFIAGTDTTAASVRWAILLLAVHQEVQQKCQEELVAVVGRDRLPSWDADKSNLVYIDATIREVQRVADIIPSSVPHAAREDTELRGYLIPKGSWIIPNLNACHRDPKCWDEPEKFDPSRFLDESGRALRNDHPGFLPFGSGKRRCIGEKLAVMELFIFITYILHNFYIKLPAGFEPELNTNVGADAFMRRPPPFQVILKER